MFTGKEWDATTGLYDFGARQYDPRVGQWLSPDPAFDGLNLYAYVHNNPVNMVDPTGLSAEAKEWTHHYEGRPTTDSADHEGNQTIAFSDDRIRGPGQEESALRQRSAQAHAESYANADQGGMTSLRSEPVPVTDTSGTMTKALGAGMVIGAAPLVLFTPLAEIGATAAMRAGMAASVGVPLLRQQYVDAVKSLADRVPSMRNAGMSSEQIARILHAERRALGEQFKGLTDPARLEQIYARNLRLYRDRLGPSIDWLRNEAGKSWDEIISSASRPGGKDLGF